MPPLRQTTLSFKSVSSSASAAQKAAEGTTNAKDGQEKDVTEPKVPAEIDNPTKGRMLIKEKIGAIFAARDGTVIIHACNCIGSWSGGIAVEFQKRYPKAFDVYKKHCDNTTPTSLISTALLIPPMETSGPRHFVGCLFTSKRYGRGKDTPKDILKQTAPAMRELLQAMDQSIINGEKIEEVRMCQINSGLFDVPWEKSKAIIESLDVGDLDHIPKEIVVYSLPPKKETLGPSS